MVELFGIKKLKNVNKIVLNNLEIEQKIEYENNEYSLYLIKYKLIKMISEF